jgi:hypothetical protein
MQISPVLNKVIAHHGNCRSKNSSEISVSKKMLQKIDPRQTYHKRKQKKYERQVSVSKNYCEKAEYSEGSGGMSGRETEMPMNFEATDIMQVNGRFKKADGPWRFWESKSFD